jgi:hypothetical protein
MKEGNEIRQGDSSNSLREKSSDPAEHQSVETDAPALKMRARWLATDRESEPGNYEEATVAVEYKHSLATRWMHWINFTLLFVMIYSGILIYWADSQHEGLNAHHVYRIGIGDWTLFRFFPRWFYNNLHLKFQLAEGLAYHFLFTWFFALNGVAYVFDTFLSREWRNLVPTRSSLPGDSMSYCTI